MDTNFQPTISTNTRGQPVQLRRHAGYDHGYYFIASFMEEHVRFHARNCKRKANAVLSRMLIC